MSALGLTCKRCAVDLDEVWVNLCASRERTVPIGPSTIETQVLEAWSLDAWCPKCGDEATLQHEFARRGLVAVAVVADPPTPLCARCQGAFIDEEADHLVVMVGLEEISGSSVQPLEYWLRAVVCPNCEAALRQEGHL